jgi:hypothetical protein
VRRTATIGLGRATVSAITDGVPWVVLCVNTQRPLFWLLARETYATVDQLMGRRVAMHAPRTAPGCFARIVLRRHGLDPDGRHDPAVAAQALSAIAKELGATTVPDAARIFRTDPPQEAVVER